MVVLSKESQTVSWPDTYTQPTTYATSALTMKSAPISCLTDVQNLKVSYNTGG